MHYRPEIDGLRAIAVLPVLLFHAGVPGFGGGYVGVDVFFVISGYLITRIILRDLEKNSFSLRDFYERRARRILPALYLVIICTLPLAWVVMMPSQLEDFSQSLVAISFFGANIYFYLKSGYFEPAAELNPMLHTWSLAVEEQFYFCFPLFLMAVFRMSRRAIVPMIIVLALISFYRSNHLLSTDPSAGFFLPFGRAWELALGALINFLPHREKPNKAVWEISACVGLLAIFASVVFLDGSSPFPGTLALPSTVGAALVIYSTRKNCGIGKLMAQPALVGIGLISYSLYLWHQPIFAVTRISTLGEPSLHVFLLLTALSFGLAYVSWRFVETPFRSKKTINLKTLLAASVSAVLLVSGIGVAGHFTKGFAEIKYQQAGAPFEKFDKRLAELRNQRNRLWKEKIPQGGGEFSGSQSVRKVLVIGDSRAEDLYVALKLNEKLFANSEFRLQRLDELCFPALRQPTPRIPGTCGKEIEEFRKRMKGNGPDLVLISCGWLDESVEQMSAMLDQLGETSCIVFGNASFNEIDSQFYAIFRRDIPRSDWPRFFTKNVHERSRKASIELEAFASRAPLKFVNTYELYRTNTDGNDLVPIYNLVTDDGDPLIIDQTHVTVEGARRFGKTIHERGWIDYESS